MSSNSTATPGGIGTIMRLHPLEASDLPDNPGWGSSAESPSRPSLKAFVETALLESHAFIEDMHLGNLPKAKTIKSPPSTAEVAIHKKTITPDDLQKKAAWDSTVVPSRKGKPTTRQEMWVARRSIHVSESKEGTASWEEFCSHIRSHHSKYEAEYTPDIYERKEILSWATEISATAFDNLMNVEMELVEMNHKMPPPLQPRSFCTLVVSGNVSADCFVVAQIPVDVNSLPASVYSPDGKKTVKGIYVSIERCERKPEAGGEIVWTMATASDAGGNLPQFAQNMGIPGAIAKDVGYFVEWIGQHRKSAD